MTNEEKYERVLHAIQRHAAVTMDYNKLKEIIGAICDWSYAHRVGNGEYSEEEQQEIVDRAFERLCQLV